MRQVVRKHIQSLYPQYVTPSLETPIHKDEAYPVVDQFFFGYFNKGQISTWSREDRFSKKVETVQSFDVKLSNSTSDGYIAINRKFEPQSDGRITLQSVIVLENADNGARIYLDNTDGENVFEFVSKNGFFFVKAKEETATNIAVHDGATYFRADFDLDTKMCRAYIDGAFACDFSLSDFFKDFGKITVSTSAGYDDLSMQMRRMYIRRNYAVDENFYAPVYPADWESCPEAKMIRVYNDAYESGTLKLDTTATAKKCHRTLEGKIVFESFFYLPHMEDTLKIKFDNAATVTVKDGTVSAGDISHSFIRHIWQNVRIVADTEKGEADLYICGKIKGKIPFDAKSASFVSFEYQKNSEDGYALIDDVRVYNIFDYPDYCPEPVVPESRGVNAIMSVCSLWHEGGHHGYDYIAPYDECTPLLGYYDEGSIECADWETKYMLEQGISAFQYCWYTPQSNDPTIPIKTPRAFWHQYEGYFYGRYSHMLPFCILWENYGWGQRQMTLEEFRRFVWDYWVEWCFRDPRYYRIDNKAVFHIYRHDLFLNTFGSVEKCKEVIDFMREDIKNYGYDGLIALVNCGNAYSTATVKMLDAMGFDGLCNYGWGKPSFAPDYINHAVGRIINNFEKIGSDMYTVPTVGTGRNIMGWEDTRTPLSTPEQYAGSIKNAIKLCERQKHNPNLIYFSTWNEYGEGHWLAPTGLNGFGYSDAQRSVLCKDTELTHVTPSACQMARIAHLHNDYRTPIRSWLQQLPDVSKLDCEVVFDFDMNIENWDFEDVYSSQDPDGSIVMDGYDIDPKAIFKHELNIPANNIEYIHVRLSTNSFDMLQIFFATDTHPEFFATGYIDFFVPERDVYMDLYIETKHVDWNGIIKNIRIDTGTSPALVKIQKIEFLKTKPIPTNFGFVVDGVALKIPFYYKDIRNGEYYLAANPKNGTFAATNIYHEWDRFEGKLYLKTGTDTEFLFTVGSDTVLINGNSEKLSEPFYLYDQMPVLPLKFIFEKAGIKYEISDNTVFITIR